MKVLILIVCCRDDKHEYEALSNAIKTTWGKTATEDVRIYYLWCNNYVKKDDNDFVLNKAEGYGMLLWKTLGFLFEHRHDEFDYIVRVNVGSYVNVNRLMSYLKESPKNNFYCGQVGEYDGIAFVSGSCFILSRDLVFLSLRNIKKFGFDHIDDVSFGRFMGIHGITPTFCYTKLKYINDKEDDGRTYHWKLRSPDGQRHLDCERMKKMYNEFR